MKLYRAPTPDNLKWPTTASLSHAEIHSDGSIHVIWKDAQTSRFHPLWLRDNCACDQCLHSVTREHLSDLMTLSLGITASNVSIDDGGDLSVHFENDQHHSVFNTGWLFAHSGLSPQDDQQPFIWNAEELAEPISFNCINGELSDEQLLKVLLTVEKTGLARVRQLGSSKDAAEAFGLRIGPVRETHFARIFDVISRPDADSNAYTSERLSAHTDIPTRESPPGLQVLHCLIANARGGESTMTDGFKIAADLADHYPQDFKILSSVKWCFANRGGDTDYRWNAPIINLDEQGNVFEIRLLPFSRAPLMTDFELIEPTYRALKRFMTMANSDKYQMRYQLEAGDLIIFDNRRILHGREAFDPQSGDRALRGLYLDRDDMLSTIRMIRNKQTETD